MKLISISLRNVRIRALSSVLTTVSIGIGTMLLASLWMLSAQAEKQYSDVSIAYGAIVGAQSGSALDLVLNTVYNVGTVENRVAFSVYRELRESKGRIQGARNQVIFRYVIPQARGDTFRGFPIVGTTDEMFSKFHFEVDADKKPVPLALSAGRTFSYSHEKFVAFSEELAAKMAAGESNGHGHSHDHSHSGGGTHTHGDVVHYGPENEAVIGAEVARRLGIGLGDPITPMHGKADDPNAHVHVESMCQVVGILERTGTPVDRVIYIPVSTFLTMDGHEAIRETDDAAADNVMLTAIICRGKRPNHDMNLRYVFEGRRDAQAVFTRQEINEFLEKVGTATRVLDAVSYLVLIVAAAAVLVALYNTMNERRREIAIMRSLGARRAQIATIVLGEAAVISLAGGVLGIVGCHGVAMFSADVVADMSGVLVDWAAFSLREVWLILGVAALGCVAGVLPALKGSRTEVAENLGPIS